MGYRSLVLFWSNSGFFPVDAGTFDIVLHLMNIVNTIIRIYYVYIYIHVYDYYIHIT